MIKKIFKGVLKFFKDYIYYCNSCEICGSKDNLGTCSIEEEITCCNECDIKYFKD